MIAVTRRFDWGGGGEGGKAQEFGRVHCDRRLQRTKFKNRRGTDGQHFLGRGPTIHKSGDVLAVVLFYGDEIHGGGGGGKD